MPRLNIYDDDYYPSPWQQTWREFKDSHISMIALFALAVFLVFAIFAPIIAPYNPIHQNTNAFLIPPSWHANGDISHLLGTDSLGRDVLSRIIYACRVTFGSSVILVLLSMLIGVAIGSFAGMLSGVRSSIINHLLDALMAIPTLLIAIIIVAILGTGLFNCMLAITLALIPQFIHYSRTFVRDEMGKDYIEYSLLDGANKFQLFFHSILPNMIEMLVVQGTLALSLAVIDISALGFLNLGAKAPLAELGSMISSSLEVAYIAPWNIALPGLCVFLMVLSITLVGDGLRAALRKRLSR